MTTPIPGLTEAKEAVLGCRAFIAAAAFGVPVEAIDECARLIAVDVTAAVRAATLDEAANAVDNEVSKQRGLLHATPYGADQIRAAVRSLKGAD